MTIGRIHGLLPFGVAGMGRRNHRHDEHDLGPSAFTLLFRLILRSLQRRRERMAMASLSDHLLRDIGLSRTTAAWDPEIRNRLP
ncbi:MAG TPA: DUF1127 domain-containing protein [Dongiaceae bacterium]|jgi:uncharacterized protein YjiS (DUF1127 family)